MFFSPTERKVQAAFALSFICLAIIGTVSYLSVAGLRRDAGLAAHTHELIAALRQLLSTVTDAETAQRGYIITGEEKYLEPYRAATERVGGDLQTVRELTADHAAQRHQTGLLAPLVTERMAVLEETLGRLGTEGFAAAQAAITGGRGKELHDRIRRIVAAMEGTEQALLREQEERAGRSSRRARAVIIGGSALALTMVAVALLVIGRDFAGGRRAEAALRQAHAELERRVAERTAELEGQRGELQLIMDSVPALIFYKDLDHCLVQVNHELTRLMGMTRAELVGRTNTQLGSPEAAQYHRDEDEVIATGQPKRHLIEPLLTSAGVRWLQTDKIPRRDADGRIVGVIGFAVDITERRHAEEQMARLAAIVNSSDDAIISKTLEGIITSWNPGAEKVFGYSAAEAVGKPMLMLFPPERVQEEAVILARIGRGESVTHFETVRVRRDGRLMDVSVTISPITDSAGQIIGASKIARDITEQKRADQTLRDSEARKAAVLDTALDCIITMDRDGRIVEFNPAAERAFGHSRSEAIGAMMADLVIPPAWRERHERGLAHYLATGEGTFLGKLLELPALRADGSEFPAEIAINVMEVNGQPMFTASLRDITERVQAAAALREREESFRTMANSIPQLAWNARADGFIFWYNQRWYDYTGTTPAQMEGWGWQSVHDPERLSKVMEQWTGAIASGQPFEMEFPLRGADGKFRRFLTRAQPLKNAAGQVVQWFGTNTDVDELKRVEDSLRKSEASLADAQSSAKMGNWELDFATQTGTWSAEMFRLFDRDPALGVPSFAEFETLPHPDDRESFARLHPAAVAAGRSFEQDFRVIRPDGSIRWIAGRAEMILDANGNPVRMIGTSQDITERKAAAAVIHKLNAELEQRVIERTAQLEAANKELEAFSYSVSHDLRAPLRGIAGFSQALDESCGKRLEETERGYLSRVRAAAERMGQLIDDLLDLARVSRVEMVRQPVDLSALARGVVADLQQQAPARVVAVEIADGLEAEGDPRLLRVLLENLLGNAWKFTGKHAQPTIAFRSLMDDSNQQVFLIRDDGSGFDMQYAGKLFGAFQRLHALADFPGTGIGLATVQRIVHRHGGRVWAEGAVGRGATFFFTLPRLLR